jgi:two-component system response regulator LytT
MKNNFKILIVDDEVLIAEFLKDVLISLDYTVLKLAHNKNQALLQLKEFMPDLVLLDIRMKRQLEGIEIAKEINAHYNIPFIFITAHSDKDIVQKALDTKPAGYITKPFKKMDVFAAVHLVQSNKEIFTEKYLIFKDGYENVKLLVDDVLYAQCDNNYIHIFTADKKHTLRSSLEWLKENLPHELFHQTHRSYIVNITKITKSNSKSVFINDIEIPVSRRIHIKLD